MLEENKFILKHKNYTPSNIVYGFLGKNFPAKSHRYRAHTDSESDKKIVLNAFGSQYHSMAVLHQVHGNKSIIIDSSMDLSDIEADAHVTKDPSLLLAIQTADCVPLIFIDNDNKIVGAAHAGWRGAISDIVDSVMKKMEEAGAEIGKIDVLMGPCIHQDSYEVGQEFYDVFLEKDKVNDKFFYKKGEKYYFDLPAYVTSKIKKYSINNFYNADLDTLKDEKKCFSYRRDFKKGRKLEGHILSVVGIK
ncbi:MAG: peptidoglycan editing factor PgeF [Alphaproteobacteria bacterium]|nr:peptidoglycan editing factor PgeF [Alphaproteobacteria bacterium]